MVTLYQYLRLRGYPANKISILTTYNGQKALLREEIDNRCVNNPAVRELYGRPHKVADLLASSCKLMCCILRVLSTRYVA